MINNEWERFGEDIRRTIQNAVDSRDFSRLNQTVSDTIGQAMNTISRGLNNGGWYREPGRRRTLRSGRRIRIRKLESGRAEPVRRDSWNGSIRRQRK